MRTESFRFASEDGVQVYVRGWLPAEAPKAVLQIAHGMGEHSARYSPLAERACEQGIAVYAHDQRGHGLSVAAGDEHGHMAHDDGFNRAVADIHQLAVQLKQRHPDIPRAMMGHSMGSFMLQQILFQHPHDGDAFVLSATNGPPPAIAAAGRSVARAERMRVGARGHSPIIDKLTFRDFNSKFAPNRTENDWLSRDEAEVDKYTADPHCGFLCSVQTWIDFLDAMGPLTEARNVSRIPRNKPVYVFAGTRDVVGDMGRGPVKLVDIYRDHSMSEVQLRMYEGGRHEMLNETNRSEVIADLLGWLVPVLGIR